MKRSPILISALILTGGNVFLRLSGMLFQVFLSRRIGAAGLGIVQLVSAVSIFAAAVGCSGAKVASMVLTAEEYGRKHDSSIRRTVHACLLYGLTVSLLAAIVLFALSRAVAGRWIGSLEALDSIRMIAVFLPFTCGSMIMAGYFTACGKVRQLVLIEMTERTVCLGLTLAFLLLWAKKDLGRGLSAITLGASIGCVADFCILYGSFLKNTRHCERPSAPPHLFSRLIKLCAPLAANDYLRNLLAVSEQFLIPFGLKKHGADYLSAMRAYGTIHGMVFPLLMFPAVFMQSLSELLVPTFARKKAENRYDAICRVCRKSLRMCLLYTLTVAGFFTCTARPLGFLVYKSTLAGKGLLIFAPMLLMLYMDAITDGMLKGLAEQLACVRYNTLTNFLQIVLLLALLPVWGITGYCVSFFVTHLINFILSLRRLCKVTGFRLDVQYCGSAVLCAIVASAAASICPLSQTPPSLQFLLRGSLYLGVWVLGLSGTGRFPRTVKRALRI